MIIALPVLGGSRSRPVVQAKIDIAVDRRDFPIILDCKDVTLTSSSLADMIAYACAKAKAVGGDVELINVSADVEDMVLLCGLRRVISKISYLKEKND